MRTPLLTILICCIAISSVAQTDSTPNKSENLFHRLSSPDSVTKATVKVYQDPVMQKSIEAQKNVQNVETQKGFRVQLFSSNNAQTASSEAFNIEKIVTEKLPNIPVFVTYTSPFWKVRVGNCTTQAEAQKLRQYMLEQFPQYQRETYIVPDRIVITK